MGLVFMIVGLVSQNGDGSINPVVMQHIGDVVNNMATPLWLRSVPRNFGDASAGTLKADEWHTMFTVFAFGSGELMGRWDVT